MINRNAVSNARSVQETASNNCFSNHYGLIYYGATAVYGGGDMAQARAIQKHSYTTSIQPFNIRATQKNNQHAGKGGDLR